MMLDGVNQTKRTV